MFKNCFSKNGLIKEISKNTKNCLSVIKEKYFYVALFF
jgi:hypothetical protein